MRESRDRGKSVQISRDYRIKVSFYLVEFDKVKKLAKKSKVGG